MSDNKLISPIEYIVMLIVGQMKTFDEAYRMVNEVHFKQYGKDMDKNRVLKAVMKELKKELGVK